MGKNIIREDKIFTISSRNYVTAVRNEDGKLLREVKWNGKLYRKNSAYGTYNSTDGNELLSRRDVE